MSSQVQSVTAAPWPPVQAAASEVASADQLGPGQAGIEVLCIGTTFCDLVVTGLTELPQPGAEVYGTNLHTTWGGMANLARVLAALQARTGLCTPIGDDPNSAAMVRSLEQMGIELGSSPRFTRWPLPITVALATSSDRAMATVELPSPHEFTQNLTADQVPDHVIIDVRRPRQGWLDGARARGVMVFGTRGDDPTGQWDPDTLADPGPVDVLMLNDREACSFAREPDPVAAARTLAHHGAGTPVVIVTRGGEGLVAHQCPQNVTVTVPAFEVEVVNTTGAGDATLAGFVWAHRWPELDLTQRLHVAALYGALTVAAPCGALTPPTPTQIVDRLRGLPEGSAPRQRYQFLLDLLTAPGWTAQPSPAPSPDERLPC